MSGRERGEIERDKQRRKERAERERQAEPNTPSPFLFCSAPRPPLGAYPQPSPPRSARPYHVIHAQFTHGHFNHLDKKLLRNSRGSCCGVSLYASVSFGCITRHRDPGCCCRLRSFTTAHFSLEQYLLTSKLLYSLNSIVWRKISQIKPSCCKL